MDDILSTSGSGKQSFVGILKDKYLPNGKFGILKNNLYQASQSPAFNASYYYLIGWNKKYLTDIFETEITFPKH